MLLPVALKGPSLLLKGIVGGVLAVLVTWIGIVAIHSWRWQTMMRQTGTSGLGASAGGWTLLLHTPWVLILLALAFGIGLYLAAR